MWDYIIPTSFNSQRTDLTVMDMYDAQGLLFALGICVTFAACVLIPNKRTDTPSYYATAKRVSNILFVVAFSMVAPAILSLYIHAIFG